MFKQEEITNEAQESILDQKQYDNYLKHIGLEGIKLHANLKDLATIAKKHLYAIDYVNSRLYVQGQNKDKTSRKITSLQLDDIYQELITEKKPGFCFQSVELLYAVLTKIGFTVERHVAKVINKFDSEIKQAEIDGKLEQQQKPLVSSGQVPDTQAIKEYAKKKSATVGKDLGI